MSELLEQINGPNDIKGIAPGEYRRLAQEIRRFLVQKISRTGGHLASNLGVVELTMALHLCCSLPEDKIVWDVGHQCYIHKLLTGRREGFDTLRQYQGMSGFPKRAESDCDIMDTGHSSTSVSAALGLAKARDICGENYKVFAVIGDGALSGGMAYEALNNAARLKSNLIIVLNDNEMSISKNVGGMSSYLGKIRTNTNYTGLKEDVEKVLQKMPYLGSVLTAKIRGLKDLIKRILIPGMLFEDMGLTYIGPIDGHDIKQMVMAFQSAAKLNKAVMVHVITQKGRGYLPAQKDPSAFHGVAPFYVKDGKERQKGEQPITYTDVFSRKIVEEAKANPAITAVSAAMPLGTGLVPFAEKFPKRFFDVGIAEEHAVTFAAGMAAGGLHPVVAVYSTFLQRAYDQMIHDVCLNRLPVTFAIDRAGLVGSDGETHQGIFDLAYLMQMPGLMVMAPKNVWEMGEMLHFAVQQSIPVAIRYPRGKAYEGLERNKEPISAGKGEWIVKGKEIALLAIGSMVETAMEARELLKREGFTVSVVNARFAKPLDEEMLFEAFKMHSVIVTLEEGIQSGGFGEAVAAWYQDRRSIRGQFLEKEAKVCIVALPDRFIEHGSVKELKKKYHLDAESIAKKANKAYSGGQY
ncbi:1-deoxy-D-xylulose-5-phosphate synthase [bacterium D16-51]|nr:1-deoxy-D-xylulose-5-phosphate synthase [bacterium D16-59]RKI54923.1 1-deoxy-D-xylulose-5-phosphate synthase [bacterium D16-51]